MPVVPEYERTEVLRPNFRQGIDVQASPEDFGAAVGRGLSSLAGGLRNASTALDAIAEKDAETEAKQADMTLQESLGVMRNDPESGYIFKNGEDAVKAYPDVRKQFEEARKKAGEGLSPRARQLYDIPSMTRIRGASEDLMVHTGNERKRWYSDTTKARAQQFGDEAISNWADPRKQALSIGSGLREIEGLGNDLGWDKATLDLEQKKFVSSVFGKTTEHIAQSDPLKAQEYFEARKSQMNQDDILATEKMLKTPVLGAETDQDVINMQDRHRVAPAGRDQQSFFLERSAAPKFVNAETLRNVNPAFGGRLQQALAAAEKETGGKAAIRDFYRPPERQAQYHRASIMGGGRAAPPGKSRHQTGSAADLNDGPVLAWLRSRGPDGKQNAARFGLELPFADDTGHIQLAKGVDAGTPAPRRMIPTNEIIMASGFLRPVEAFRSKPYMDRTAWRGGYGSDTVTRADGTFVRVTPGMVITQDDAERDLRRRSGEVAAFIRDKVGADAWARLPVYTKAAAISVAYNYGQHEVRPRGDLAGLLTALRGGDPQAVAAAILQRARDNGGINAKRRAKEANLAMGVEPGTDERQMVADLGPAPSGVHVPDAVAPQAAVQQSEGTLQGGSSGDMLDQPLDDYLQAEEYLNSIKDPERRALARTKWNAHLNAQIKALELQEAAAKEELWRVVDTGGTPDDASPLVRQRAGREAVAGAWTYVEQQKARGEAKTDWGLYSKIQMKAATDPEGFVDMDITEAYPHLAPTERKELIKLRADTAQKMTEKRVAATDVKAALSQADDRLDAFAEFQTTGVNDATKRQKAEEARDAFNQELVRGIEEFRQKNGVAPDQMQVDAIINRLLLPIVIKKKPEGFLADLDRLVGFKSDEDTVEEKGRLYQAARRPDGTTVEIRMEYNQVPYDMRPAIIADLQKRLGRKPTPAEVTDRYEQYLMGQ